MTTPHTTSQKIQEAANSLFAEKGFSATSMSDIAGRAGISKASLYYFFESKEKLFCSILREALEEANRLVGEILAKDPESGEVGRLIRGLLTIGVRHKLFVHPPDRDMLKADHKELFALIIGLQKQCTEIMRRNQVSEPELATDLLFYSLQGYMRRRACSQPVASQTKFTAYLTSILSSTSSYDI